jgi:hypothetical protein
MTPATASAREVAGQEDDRCPDCGFLSCICFDDEDQPEDEYDPSEECGRWINGRLDGSCTLAGTEFCDWDCPYSR